MSFAVTVSSPSLLLLLPKKSYFRSYPKFLTFRNLNPLQASRGTSNFPQGSESLVDDPRNWSRRISQRFDEDYGDNDDEEDDEEEEDRSLDLLVRFVENVFNKVSRRARKAARSVLPLSISTKLVGFSVNGVLILAFLWVLKAFLEVVCTLGSVVFVSILLIRGVWTGLTYLQESRSHRVNKIDDEKHAWTGAQPAS
ncbi:protein SHORT HYPOCOTYL IN WHITE LIGHT 1 [Mangifera indica]|uniref:protein SHORT HYPOCOTYL IN WHITE LIGHT 1 n=1 Tax=Mangifera indica TaxID=29780 RepID=UPI001CFB45A0|nr:protein SHORT HYPOCOTYL IN WHITE LIGHT 1 [Mangifera indica]